MEQMEEVHCRKTNKRERVEGTLICGPQADTNPMGGCGPSLS